MTSKKTIGIFLLIAAIVSVVFAIVCFTSSDMSYHAITTIKKGMYGGDAYTDIQNATAEVANTAKAIHDDVIDFYYMIARCFGFVFVVTAIVLVTCGVGNLLAAREAAEERYLQRAALRAGQATQNQCTATSASTAGQTTPNRYL